MEGVENVTYSTKQHLLCFSVVASLAVLTATPVWGQTGMGLKADYYANATLSGTAALSRTDANINFQWGSAAPADGLPTDKFSVRWSGQIEAPISGVYTFITRSDDGVRLWVNQKNLINNWSDHGSTYDQTIPINLIGGRKYDIQLEYYDSTGTATIQLFWSYSGQTEQIVPMTWLSPASITLQPAPSPVSRVMLGDLPWLSATNGSGPVERNKSVGGGGAGDGTTLKIGSRSYSKGLGVHADSEVRFALDDTYDLFKAVIGVDTEVGTAGSVVFEVWVDGRRLYVSPLMRGGMPGVAIEVPVEDALELKLVVKDGGDGNASDHADWADARFEGVEQIKYLSDLSWTSATNGSGPVEKDKANGGSAAGDGTPLLLKGQQYKKGLGTRANAEIKYNLNKQYDLFSSVLGIDDSANGAGSVVYEVWGDTSLLYRSDLLKASSPAQHISLSVRDKALLTLKVLDGGDGTTGDLADWADAKLLPIGSDPAPLTTVPPAPSDLRVTPGSSSATLYWTLVPGATAYRVYRSATPNNSAPLMIGMFAMPGFISGGLTNGTTYYFRVAAANDVGVGAMSAEVSVTPGTPPAAPSVLTAVPAIGSVTLNWTASTGATSYHIFRSTTSNGQSAVPIGTASTTTFTSTGLTVGTTYFFKVAAVNAIGVGPMSGEASAGPTPPPAAPTNVSATGGDKQVTLSWAVSAGATSYNIYRGTTSNGQAAAAVANNLTSPTFTDTTVTNSTTYYYKVTALNGAGESPKSSQVAATPTAPPPAVDPAYISAWRLLRRATWGPTPGEADRVKQIGPAAFLNEQFAAPMSVYPDTLYTMSVEDMQEHFMKLGLTGPDQLRQRIAWALHEIWVVSAVEITKTDAMVNYQRVLLNHAFGNYRNLMRDMTLNPAMGRYLNMLNNRSKLSSGVDPNENYARELMQLFTIGIPTLNPNGSPMLDSQGQQIPAYTETDVKQLARILTGWTFGDGDPATIPTRLAPENWRVPMEAVERYHDVDAKTFLGVNFGPGQSAKQDLDQALDVIFNHPNLPVFVSRQLIQRLVRSNPSPTYISDIAAVFRNNGQGVRGDLVAVVRAILTHSEAQAPSTTGDKLMEPALYVLSQMRALNAQVVDHPFMSNKSEEMGQRVFYPASVFSYFSPGFRVRGTNGLIGPEFQGLTTVTALVRSNFIANLLKGQFGADVTVDYTPFTSRAADPAALVDYCNSLFMGGLMSAQQRAEIISAISITAATNTTERARTAIYLTLASGQFQIDR